MLPANPQADGAGDAEVPLLSRDDSEAAELVFWQSVQASGKPDEYEAYLCRFPAGVFSELAHSRLSERPALSQEVLLDRSVELAYWNSVQNSDAKAMYEAYLTKYPGGEFKALAELRLLLEQGGRCSARALHRPVLIRAA